MVRIKERSLTDPQVIMRRLACEYFPFDMPRALEMALFRSFACPRISMLLQHTGEMVARPQKRYDDTDLILSEIIENGYDSARGRLALRRMNQIHRYFTIENEDYLYVLSTFIFEPIRWIDRFGWRQLTPEERHAQFTFWTVVGTRMGIRNIPAEYGLFDAFNRRYEIEHFRMAESNQIVASATQNLFLGWLLPSMLWPLGRTALNALMDDNLLMACGLRAPHPFIRAIVVGTVRLRAKIVKWLPRRQQPRLRTRLRRATYPTGYQIRQLGPDRKS